jgi:hypothetical protein
VRPIVGKINSSLIGQARTVLRDRLVENGGIDDPLVGRLRLAQAQPEPIWGFDEKPDPVQTIMALNGLKLSLIESIDPTDENGQMDSVRGTIDDIRGTIDYLCSPQEVLLTDKLLNMATQLSVEPQQLRTAITEDRKRSAERLLNDKHELLAVIADCGSRDCEFEELPLAIQIGISESLDKSIASSYANALRTVLRPTNRIGDIPILQRMAANLKSWREHMSRTNPAFAMRMMGIG